MLTFRSDIITKTIKIRNLTNNNLVNIKKSELNGLKLQLVLTNDSRVSCALVAVICTAHSEKPNCMLSTKG